MIQTFVKSHLRKTKRSGKTSQVRSHRRKKREYKLGYKHVLGLSKSVTEDLAFLKGLTVNELKNLWKKEHLHLLEPLPRLKKDLIDGLVFYKYEGVSKALYPLKD